MAHLDLSLVSALPLFAGFEAAELDEILREAHPLHRPKNTVVFEQGEDAHSFFVLLHGHVRATKVTPGGHQVVVRYVTPGETFGVAVAIGLSAYPATATAVDDSLVLAWPSSAWPRLVEKYPALAAKTLQTVGERLQESHKRIIEMSSEQVERRVARTLLRLVQQAGRKTEKGIEIDFPISRQDIAEMTGTTLHSVSRTLSGWEGQGVVEGGRQRIVVCDPHKLAEIADE
jgi:CRP-like cAMP-binding protein